MKRNIYIPSYKSNEIHRNLINKFADGLNKHNENIIYITAGHELSKQAIGLDDYILIDEWDHQYNQGTSTARDILNSFIWRGGNIDNAIFAHHSYFWHGITPEYEYCRLPFRSIFHSEAGYFKPISWSDKCDEIRSKVKIKDWRTHGNNIAVCLNNYSGWMNKGVCPYDWCYQVIDQCLKYYTDKTFYIIDHPTRRTTLADQKKNDMMSELGKYGDKVVYGRNELGDYWAAIVYNSSVAINFMINGIPTFVTNNDCFVYDWSAGLLSDVENPKYFFDREEIIRKAFAHTHYRYEELSNGIFWNSVKERYK
mgnify:CR=1 FL=1